jgi:hypothetical protein
VLSSIEDEPSLCECVACFILCVSFVGFCSCERLASLREKSGTQVFVRLR